MRITTGRVLKVVYRIVAAAALGLEANRASVGFRKRKMGAGKPD
jgi:hypothetical protein